MLKRILIIAGILVVGIASSIQLNKLLEGNTTVTNREEQVPFVTKEEQSMAALKEKLHEKYVGVDVKATSKKELVLQIVGDEEYFKSVKKDMETITKSVIKSSTLKDYTVTFERWDFLLIPDDIKKIHEELNHLSKTLMEELNADYDAIVNINDSQKSITIHTTIKGSDKDAHKIAMKIEETINEILHSKELKSISYIDSYEIKILNAKGNVVN